jgi:GT2 family glycosyltransferase
MPEELEQPLGLRVSVILIARNQAEPLRRAIAAVEKSTERERIEILVVDCASTDGGAQIDSEFPSVAMLRLPHNFGATKAMNIGARTAKADLLFYLSPEVEVEPATISALAEKLENDPDAIAVCPLLDPSSRVHKLPDSASLKLAELPVEPVDTSAESVAVAYPGREALLVRRQFVKGMNYFDERFGEFWADADLAMQIRRANKKIRLYPSIKAKISRSAPPPLNGLLAADRFGGAAALIGKYQGFFPGLMFRIGSLFRALGKFDFKQLIALARGEKVDGSQGG